MIAVLVLVLGVILVESSGRACDPREMGVMTRESLIVLTSYRPGLVQRWSPTRSPGAPPTGSCLPRMGAARQSRRMGSAAQEDRSERAIRRQLLSVSALGPVPAPFIARTILTDSHW